MSHERDQVQLQRHIKEAEERATAGGAWPTEPTRTRWEGMP
jgi:hypothetical protein